MYAIGIVTYQPDVGRLAENLRAVTANDSVGCLIVVDNHSDNISDIRQALADILSSRAWRSPLGSVALPCNPQAILIENDDNLGIATALNQLCRKAQEQGCEWLATLDQDSVLESHIMQEYARYTHIDDVAIICPRIEDRNMGRQYARSNQGTEYIARCITSGNLVRLKAWQQVGGYSDELFIDGVDFDFCLKLHEHGWRILRTNNVALLHEIGRGRQIPLPGGRQLSILNHSPQRLYYIVRNYLYIGQKHHQKGHWTWEVLKRMAITLCFEHDKWAKFRAMLKGIRDYRHGVMGRINNDEKNYSNTEIERH